MRRADEHTLATLDDIVALATELMRLYPVAVVVADDITVSRGRGDGVAVSTSTISDPTASADLDGRRARRQHRVKRSRKEIRAAATSLRSAVSSALLAADS